MAFQPQALETASSKASSVLLPPAEDLAVSYPLEVLVFVGQDTVFFLGLKSWKFTQNGGYLVITPSWGP